MNTGLELDADLTTQQSRAKCFQALHEQDRPFVIANAWDGGSAKILTKLGFPALATSSAAFAASLGRLDGDVSREEALAHGQAIARATSLPVSADLENGFGDLPATVAETVSRAAAAGMVGCSIDDSTGDSHRPIHDFTLAVERVSAATEAARGLPFPFTITARAENYVYGRSDLADTIRRLQAFERAGAHVLFAPDLPDLETVRVVCHSVSRPVNFMVGLKGQPVAISHLAEAGVRRISLSWSLYRAAMGALMQAAREILEQGTFEYVDRAVGSRELREFLCHRDLTSGCSKTRAC